jgi:hypothetical protein
MTADFSKPSLASTKTNFPTEIIANVNQAMTMDGSGSNLVTGFLKYNRTTDMIEEWNGSSWVEQGIGPVGTIIQQFATTAPTGYLLLAGGTIGDASSGASLRANADASPLFVHLWTYLANSEAAVSTGRGASAAADFAAHKTLTLPDMRQRFPIGKAASGTGATLGGTGGNIDHTHTGPAHTHTITHTHNMGNHTHSVPNHQHAAGSLRAQCGTSPGTNEYVFFGLDGVNTFTSTYRMTGAAAGTTAQGSTIPTSVVQGSTANDGGSTSGAPSSNVTDGTNTADSGSSGTGATGSGNPPFLAMNFFIKY